MSDITPALRPDEWKELATESVAQFDDVDVVDGVVNLNCEQWVPVKNPHRLAALALHQQPFGFTWADVELLDEMLDERPFRPDGAALESLRDRIAALLPPRENATEVK